MRCRVYVLAQTTKHISTQCMRTVVVFVSVQGVQNRGPHFQFTRFTGDPIFSLSTFKDL